METDKAFFKVWNNIVLFNEIFKHVKIYQSNKFKVFKNLKEIKEYGQLEYINTLAFNNDNEEIITNELLKCYELRILMICSDPFVISVNENTKYPNKIEQIIFPPSNEINVNIDNNSIPNTIKRIENVYFDKTSSPSSPNISDSITSISFSGHFNESLSNGYLNSNLRVIQFIEIESGESIWNNQEMVLKIGDIPYGCEILDLGLYQNELNANVLPNSIKELTMYHVDGLIISDSIIPNSVNKLHIYSYDYESKIQFNDYSLPISIIELTLDSYETILSPNCLNHLSSLKTLNLGLNFSTPLLIGVLPSSLENLNISTYSNSFYIEYGALPNKLKSIKCNSYITEYTIGDGTINSTTHCSWIKNGDLKEGYLPNSITYLNFGNHSNINITSSSILPKSLLTLVLGKSQISHVDLNNLPSTINCLDISYKKLTNILNIEENKQILIKR